MADLKISDDILDDLKAGLKSIVDQLRSSANFGHDVANLIGHSELSSRVSSFAGDWEVHRNKMVDATTKVHDEVVTITDKFSEVDGQLKGALDTKGN